MGFPIHFATCARTCQLREITTLHHGELFKFRKKFLNRWILNFWEIIIREKCHFLTLDPPCRLKSWRFSSTGTGTTIRTPNFKLDFFQEQRLLEEKNDIGTKITMLNLLPGQVLHFPAKGTYWIFIPKSVRKKKWSTKCTPTYLDFSFKVIVSCEFWALDVLDEVTTSLTYVFHRKTATFCMFFFQCDSQGSYQTYLTEQNWFNAISSECS